MRRREDVKVFDRPPLLEEPFAQTLSGTIKNPLLAMQHEIRLDSSAFKDPRFHVRPFVVGGMVR